MDAENDTERNMDGESNVRRRSRKKSMTGSGAKEHKGQLESLQQKDPDFYEFLKEHDQELLQFSDDDIDEDLDADLEDGDLHVDEEATEHEVQGKDKKASKKVITTAMVDLWCKSIKENGSLNAVRSLMKAFRAACHYGDDEENESMEKLSVMSSAVFNKIMLTVLNEMDGILRKLLKIPASGGRKQIVTDLMNTKQWRTYGHIVKSYLGNAFHILNQMTDSQMISFTLHRLKYSSVLLAAFPSLLRKYIKVALHFWGTGGGALPVVSCLFMRELCICIGSGCIDECFKGIYKAYVLNCHFVNAVKLKHIRFLSNCVIELLGVDLPTAYQHAFIFIRQLAMILRDALNTKTKEAFRKVYEWKFINCLELWTDAIRAYSSQSDFKQLAYPLTQIISGVARLVPTARYIPLRLRCIRMLNQLAASTQSFVPVSMLLLDMLEMKELSRPPTGGVGKAVDLRSILKVSKPTLKTRAFQEACVFSVVEELAEHLALWSYSVAFMELPFIPIVRLRRFCKLTKVERFRREMRQLQKDRIMEDAVKLYEHVMDSSYKPSVSNCVILLKSISGSDKPDNIIISVLCKTRRFEDAHKVIEEMQACDCKPDINTCTVLIQGYCDAGELDNALLSLYKMMETIISFKGHQNSNLFTTNLDCSPSPGTFTNESYNFPKWQQVSFTDSKFIAGNESDNSYLSYLIMVNHEKVGKLLQLIATFISGFVIAFTKGWLLTLVTQWDPGTISPLSYLFSNLEDKVHVNPAAMIGRLIE